MFVAGQYAQKYSARLQVCAGNAMASPPDLPTDSPRDLLRQDIQSPFPGDQKRENGRMIAPVFPDRKEIVLERTGTLSRPSVAV